MRARPPLTAAALCAAAACSITAAFAEAGADRATHPPDPVREWRFAVLLDGKRIGTHDFTVTGSADEARVRTHATFKVTALRIPLYHYEHEDQESWRGGCLARMDARTSDNGEESTVRGESSGQAFEVLGPKGAASLPGCVKSFAYWDKRVLAEHRLLNAQTGEYEPIEVRRVGIESVGTGARAVTAEHYSLSARKFRIDLWYSPAGEWLALQSRTEQGRTLRYENR